MTVPQRGTLALIIGAAILALFLTRHCGPSPDPSKPYQQELARMQHRYAVDSAAAEDAYQAKVREAALFTPPASYRTWWVETEACSGHTGRFDAVRWYAVPPVPGDDRFAYRDEHGVDHLSYGMWDSNGSIYLSAVYLDQASLVRHEMLH